MLSFQEWDDEFRSEFKQWDDSQKGGVVFLEEHPRYPAYFLASSFDPLFVHALKEHIGEYRAINKLKLDTFFHELDTQGYTHVVYLSDMQKTTDFLDHLDDPYPHDLNVQLKKFQLRGWNFTKDLPYAFINWSTGTGKSVYAVAQAKYLLETDQIDKVVVLSKRHNKINWQRTFDSIGNLNSSVDNEAKGKTPVERREARAALYANEDIFIINYEKLKYRPKETATLTTSTGRKRPAASGDGQELEGALKGLRVLWVWDEMTNKMKSMKTGWYQGGAKLVKKTEARHIVLTAKKIDTDPDNVYSCIKILDPMIWPSKAQFRAEYAKSFSQFNQYRVAQWDREKLPELGMKIAHFTHIANKYTDPEIKAEFPVDHWEDILIDMSDPDRKLYDFVAKELVKDLKESGIEMNKFVPLQMICNNPLAIEKMDGVMAELIRDNYTLTDKHCAKLETLQDLLDQVDGKVVLFSSYNTLGTRMLMPYIANWGHTFVLYDGSEKQMQAAQDKFKSDPNIKIFLSSDKGSDSINLEQATTVINYDLPWNHSTLVQRVNRISRLTSTADHVWFYNLIMANTMEERKRKVLENKRLMEEAIDTHVGEQSDMISNSEFESLRYILVG